MNMLNAVVLSFVTVDIACFWCSCSFVTFVSCLLLSFYDADEILVMGKLNFRGCLIPPFHLLAKFAKI